jgi:ATP-dependent DNA helicase HFM1/MER3
MTNKACSLTTPEKWDSLTRKWKELRASISQIELVLIDEVHLLHEDRGPTLEAVVSRMKTLSTDVSMMGLPIESVRFVALSATIPNLSDVGDWLGSPLEAQFKCVSPIGVVLWSS